MIPAMPLPPRHRRRSPKGLRLVAGLVGVASFAAWPRTALAPTQDDVPRPPESAPRTRTRVVLLGTGTPSPDPDRSGPATAVVVGDEAFLVDAGPGVVRRAAAAWGAGIDALAPDRLQRVFLTHLHSDHTLGLPDLMFTPWVVGRSEPLEIYGPPGTAAMVEHLEQAWSADIDVRVHGYEDADPRGAHPRVHEIEAGEVFRAGGVVVEAIPVPHGSWKHAFGYRFVTPDRTVVVSGDTAPSEALLEAARGADVLVHEVYQLGRFRFFPEDMQRYHGSFHTSSRELAALAAEARPKLVVLTHQLLWGASEEELLAEIAAGYDGRVVSGHDLDVY